MLLHFSVMGFVGWVVPKLMLTRWPNGWLVLPVLIVSWVAMLAAGLGVAVFVATHPNDALETLINAFLLAVAFNLMVSIATFLKERKERKERKTRTSTRSE